MQDAILILDHDEALAGLIARTLRSQQIYCEPVPFGIPLARAMALAPRGLIIVAAQGVAVPLSGMDKALFSAGLLVLALGGAAAALCEHLGGEAERKPSALSRMNSSELRLVLRFFRYEVDEVTPAQPRS